jgi:predicted dehydrogenase
MILAPARHDRNTGRRVKVLAVREVGIIVNGATGRIASTQHLANALLPIRAEGGLAVGDDRVMPRLLLAGRDEKRLAELARGNGIDRWTTNLDAALSDPGYSVFFDAATVQRVPALSKAVAAGKHIYSEKPVALSVADGMSLLAAARARNLKHGAVEDKIFLPGLQKLAQLADKKFFGRVTGFRLDFGWWVFEGFERKSQRPSWNYQRSGAGGLTMDMYPHWRYVIESILGPIRRIVAATATSIPQRADEIGTRYDVDVDDTSLTLAELANGAIGTIVCSWATRVRRDDLMTFQIDGTGGSAIAGLHRCWAQSAGDTPDVRHINPMVDINFDYRRDWKEVSGPVDSTNPYRIGWERFLRHIASGEPLVSDLSAGVRDVKLVEACYRSAAEGRWIVLDDA